MNIPTLGETRFASRLTHTVSDDVRVPERIEIGVDPGIQFEVAGPRAKLFFDPPKTRAGIVTCGGLCPGLNNVIRSLFLELHYAYGVAEVIGFRGGYAGLDPKCELEPVKITPQFIDGLHQKAGSAPGKVLELHGTLWDGKGEPGQANAVSHGCPAARFRGVNILNVNGRGKR